MPESPSAAGWNPYHDPELADLYAGFEYEGTYYLIARDLPGLVARHVHGRSALDFACGAGRSTRLLKRLGFEVLGVDISEEMLIRARRLDPGGSYLLTDDGDFSCLKGRSFDLILSAFPFSSTRGVEKISAALGALKNLLAPAGRLIVVEPTPEFYCNEWLSFSSNYPENDKAGSGDPVRAAFRDRMEVPVIDFMWEHQDYHRAFNTAGLRLLDTHRPLGQSGDPYDWVSESAVPPWIIYVTAKSQQIS